MYLKNIVALFTAAALCLPTVSIAQIAPPDTGAQQRLAGAASSSEKSDDLRIIVLQGEGATNNMQTHLGTAPVVEVRDRNDLPLVGAAVSFELPRTGAGGFFPDEQLTFTGRTNRQGQVGAPAFLPNRQSGRFNINVTANLGNSAGSVRIHQTNSERTLSGETSRTHKSNTWKLLAVLAAGAAVGGAILATRGGSNGANSGATVTLTPGPVGIGAPH